MGTQSDPTALKIAHYHRSHSIFVYITVVVSIQLVYPGWEPSETQFVEVSSLGSETPRRIAREVNPRDTLTLVTSAVGNLCPFTSLPYLMMTRKSDYFLPSFVPNVAFEVLDHDPLVSLLHEGFLSLNMNAAFYTRFDHGRPNYSTVGIEASPLLVLLDALVFDRSSGCMAYGALLTYKETALAPPRPSPFATNSVRLLCTWEWGSNL